MENKRNRMLRKVLKDRWLYILLLPGLLYFVVFKYFPMWGIVIAFQDYNPFLGFVDSPWVGWTHFERLFRDPDFFMLLRNTALIGLYKLVFFFPAPIIIALMLNEIRKQVFKRFVQTMVYIPHFMSWVVVVAITYVLFTTEGGVINEWIKAIGGEKINFLISSEWFRTMFIGQIIWKETGWGTILFLAALAGVDTEQYEAATIDGANRWQQTWHITFPAIRSTIIILLILRLGDFLDTGFEHVFLLLNPMNREVGEVFDTYVYAVGLAQGQYSYSTAVGLFKSVIGLALVLLANHAAKRAGQESLY
ncbi:sugar ABC transporter permease [Paenibacillus sp. IB182496]|uniref:Sugar ABC transporter permease n=1 Tax=Paenibacillus sabuli TaxID=2772509 RepID=A0A927BT09_9BACL|nr:ABC transporter permease subunit [Paenibacillus sabuli]MBD2844883.1 sugar ABC transporter permease [Paenibacillus sabuli]